jgi:hypothetical protein
LRRDVVVQRVAIMTVTHDDKLVDEFDRAQQKGSPCC